MLTKWYIGEKMAQVTLSVYDYEYFRETCLDKYGIREVERVKNDEDNEVTIEASLRTLSIYLNREYCVGMYQEYVEEIFDSIICN
ncbi:hypothetical protein BI049_gp151 [Salmonella phage vB_SnwM_CGG4-1]|uniref:Uncharacterized 8.8 kDa protein in frd-Gp32 intergenic region n=1 Tax=Salmonella phage vB_SnwM_CGG4-1 TaxID=1815631 RepID=A0A1B0VVH7_9CAUD|nr:hypothetical protein BI049_gp151 [Salmonella phage vB_SnwM_CGG4-1]ANA49582.1 hypothetical protein CGG41_228 [Salmonella phage vB_SnwM_CGG4-1]